MTNNNSNAQNLDSTLYNLKITLKVLNRSKKLLIYYMRQAQIVNKLGQYTWNTCDVVFCQFLPGNIVTIRNI